MRYKPKERKENNLAILVVSLFALLALWSIPLYSGIGGAQYTNTSVLNTTVNITNAAPLVGDVTLQNPINLVGYDNASVTCNATIIDYDNDTLTVNATVYDLAEATSGSSDDGNNHYTNSSCTRLGAQDITTNWVCGFEFNFYANNASTWQCNISAYDFIATNTTTSNNVSSNSTVNPLIAIVIPGVLDFGELVTGEISSDRLANITNGGNRNINISVEGYAVTQGDGLAMNCTYNDIAFTNMRYDPIAATAFGSMTAISNDTTMVEDPFFIARRLSEIDDNESTNTTYWKLQIPLGAGGICEGKILFTGTDSATG